MKKLIFGNGKVANIFDDENTTIVPRVVCDIRDYRLVEKVINHSSADVVINCAGLIDLEYCQENKRHAFEVNSAGPLNILDACSQHNKKFVHIGSGCIFDGNKKLVTEDDAPNPSVWYTWTKKWADDFICEHGYDNFLILRPRQLISSIPARGNMLTKFAGMKSIGAIDEPNSLTCIEDFYDMMNHLIENDHRGIFNCCNEGYITPLDISLGIREYLNTDLGVSKVTYEQFLTSVPNRRVNTIMSVEKLASTGYKNRHARDALRWCLENYDN